MIGEPNVYIAISGCQSLSQSLGSAYSSWAWSKTPYLPLELSCYLSQCQRCISGFDGHIAISGCRSLSQSLDDTLLGLAMVENPGLAVGISTLSVVVPVV